MSGRGRLLTSVFCAVAAGAAATLVPTIGLPGIVMGALAGMAVGRCWRAPNASDPPGDARVHWIERAAPAAGLLFLAPLFTMPVAPGADMAMHVALARPLLDGQAALSPAWGNLHVAAYPRGFSAWVALLSPFFGFAKAGLAVATLTYWLFLLALRQFFRDTCRLRFPGALAALVVLLAKVPERFFDWGGNPNVLALALGIFGAASIAAEARSRPLRAGAMGGLLCLGSVAIHPIGALAAGLIISVLPAWAWIAADEERASLFRKVAIASALALAGLAVGMLWLRIGGPAISDRELTWIRNWQFNDEALLRGAAWQFPFRIWPAIPRALGDPYTIAFVLAVVASAWTPRGRRALALTAGCVLIAGSVVALGPRLPGIGPIFYPSRFGPLLLLCTAPLLGVAWELGSASLPRLSRTLAAAAALAAVLHHVRWYQRAEPIATSNDVAALRCLEKATAPGALIDGPYGDATQWIPALTGRAVTHPHEHCTLFDEVDEQLKDRRPEYRFVGERLRYGAPLPMPQPDAQPICHVGHAILYRLGPYVPSPPAGLDTSQRDP